LYDIPKSALKSTYLEIQHGGCLPDFQSLNRYNFVADYSISLKLRTELEHVALVADALNSFKVKKSNAKFTAWRNRQHKFLSKISQSWIRIVLLV